LYFFLELQMQKNQTFKAGLLASLMTAAGIASAAMPPEVTSAFTSISETATGTLALVWPIAVTLTVGFVGLRLFKKGAGKAV
jgi:hypothetical protein